MTGYGECTVFTEDKSIEYLISIRALNSKQLDLSLKIPSGLRSLENLIRNEVTQTIVRGKVDLSIQAKSQEQTEENGLAVEQIRERYNVLRKLAIELGENTAPVFELAVQTTNTGSAASYDFQIDHLLIQQAVQKALRALDTFRQEEGNGIKDDLRKRVQTIETIMTQLEPHENERISQIKNRLKARFEELAPAIQTDQNRFEEELIFYLEKLDISEEKQRLGSHCAYFNQCMEEQEYTGRKLSFISQEMGREINTIGSKANHAEMQKMVVLMKDELEKIKEQLNNVL